jgi:hypothetical protein
MLAGWVALPVFDTLLAFVLHLVGLVEVSRGARWDPVDGAQSFAAGVAIISVPMTFAVALPVTHWLLKRGIASFRDFTLTGALIGNLPYALAVFGNLMADVMNGTTSHLAYILWSGPMGARAVPIGLLVGGGSGALFWWVALQGGVVPDITEPSRHQ